MPLNMLQGPCASSDTANMRDDTHVPGKPSISPFSLKIEEGVWRKGAVVEVKSIYKRSGH